MKSFNKRQLFISCEALYTTNHVKIKIADLTLWNTMRDFITFFTKYKIYESYIIILSLYIRILSCKETRLSFKEIRLSV